MLRRSHDVEICHIEAEFKVLMVGINVLLHSTVIINTRCGIIVCPARVGEEVAYETNGNY